MTGGGIAWAIESLIASAVLIAVVLAVRGPARRAFGAQVAYALWALPVLRMLLPPLPEGWRASALPMLPTAQPVTIYLGHPMASLPPITSDGGIGWLEAMLALWAVGAAAFLVWQVVGYFRFRHRVLRNGVAVDQVRSVTIVESVAASGPLAFGVIDRVVVLPSDFAARYDANERALALAHELGHHARGDLIANWVALAVLALHWFNPVAWYAFRAFRADQEMANDARVLAGRTSAERHAYACAVVKSAHGSAISAACHLHTVNDLKGRLRMLAHHRISRERLLAGSAAVVLLTLTGLGLTASGTEAAETARNGMERATGLDLATLAPIDAAIVPAAATRRERRVVIVQDGQTRTYEGAEADAYIATNPVPVPPLPPVPPVPSLPGVAPVPPVPPMPPVPPIPAEARALADGRHSVVRSGDCLPLDGEPTVIREREDGRQVTIICTNRIERMARREAQHADESVKMARLAQASALKGLRHARAGLARSPNMPAEARAEALASIDESIAEMEDDLRDVQ